MKDLEDCLEERTIKLKNKKAIVIFFIIVLVIVAIISVFEYKQSIKPKEEVKITIAKVQCEEAKTAPFTLYYDATGRVNNTSYKIGADIVRGKVSQVYVKEGDYVNQGAALLSMDVTSGVAQLKLQVVNTEQGINDLSLSISQLETKRAELQELFDAGLVAKNKLTELDNNLENLKSKRNGLLNTKDSLNKQIGEISGVAVIYAKESGIATKVKFKPNQYPTMEDFIEIRKEEKPSAKIYLTEKIVKKIHVGEELNILVNDKSYKASVKEIFSLNPGESLYPVDISIDSDDDFISGESITIKIPIYSNDKAIVVNRKAIINFNNEVYVYKVVGGKAIKTVIETGGTVDGFTEVKKGLQAGDKVIIEGQFDIDDGEKVDVIK